MAAQRLPGPYGHGVRSAGPLRFLVEPVHQLAQPGRGPGFGAAQQEGAALHGQPPGDRRTGLGELLDALVELLDRRGVFAGTGEGPGQVVQGGEESGDRGSARGAAGRLQRQGPVEGHRLPERLHRPLGVPVPLQVRTERLEGAGQLGQMDVSPVAQQLDGLPCRGQGLLRATGDGRAPGEGAQRGGEAGAEGFGALRGQLPVQGDGVLRDPAARRVAGPGEVTGETVQGRGQLGTELGPPGAEYAEAAARLLGRFDRPGGVAHGRAVMAEGVESGGEPGKGGVRLLLGEPAQEPDRLLRAGHGVHGPTGVREPRGVGQEVRRERRDGRARLLLLDQFALEPYGLLRERQGGRRVPGVGDAIAQSAHGQGQFRLVVPGAHHPELGIDPGGLLRRVQGAGAVPGGGAQAGEPVQGPGERGQPGGVPLGLAPPLPHVALSPRQRLGRRFLRPRLLTRPTVLVVHARPTVLAVPTRANTRCVA
ncbi:hypothetical protein ABZ941_29250 [Streptomyces rubiginosohelvolus]|uniref:hypothetical protein n=1 Tax=Streptomyces rubiginosohelvolus TaxID=67362 RepID=UPI0033D899C9